LARKNLPGARAAPAVFARYGDREIKHKSLVLRNFLHWHGFCSSFPAAGLGEACGGAGEDAGETAALAA